MSFLKMRVCFLCLSIINVCDMYNLQRQAQRLDDLETRLLNEGKYRRDDIFKLREKVEKLESFLKANTSVVEYKNGASDNEINLDNEDSQTDNDVVENISRMYTSLLNGLKSEKALNARARREVAEISAILASLQHDTKTSIDNMDILKSGINRVENLTLETMTRNMKMISQSEKIPHLMADVNDVKTLLENYVRNVSRPKSCYDLLRRGHTTSGLYTVYPGTWTDGIQVFCDQDSDGGGWAVFQRREDGFVNFFRGWLDYKLGFGNPLGEFWLGNEYIHHLTADCCHELRVELEDFDGNQRYAKYSNFNVGPKRGGYTLAVSGYSGDAGDSLARQNGAPFSTKDHDQSGSKAKSCAVTYQGSWWYENCHNSNLNGLYLHGNHTSYADGINWRTWTGYHYSLKFVEMKFRENI